MLPDVLETMAQTILVVEDDHFIRRLTASALVRNGFLVYDSQSGNSGMECFLEHADEIDLVLTDIVMPVVSGPEMVSRILRYRPTMRVLYMTGYNPSEALPPDQAKMFPVLPKPFSVNALLAAVHGVLNREDRSQ